MNNEVYVISKDAKLLNLIRDTLEPKGYILISGKELKIFSLFPSRVQRNILIDSSILDYSELSEDLLSNDLVIIISDKKDKSKVLDGMRRGLYGYIEKPLDTEELKIIINKITGPPERDDIITSSGAGKMKKLLKDIKRFSEDNLPVLISGEDGIDLEYYARILHRKRHKKGFFLPYDSFSGKEKVLYMTRYLEKDFTDIEGCAIFLNNISKLDKETVKALTGIAEKRGLFLIGGKIIKQDDIYNDKEILNLFDKRQIIIPPLRERREDLPWMIEGLLGKMEKRFRLGRKELSTSARSYLLKYHWPGNDREVEDTIKKAYILSEGEVIDKKDLFLGDLKLCPLEEFLSLRLRDLIKENSNLYPAVIGEVEKAIISLALKEVKGNQLKASRILGINRNTLRSKIKEHDLYRLLTK